MQKEPMETLRQALARLGGRGYRDSLRATPRGFVLTGGGEDGGPPLAPEELVVEETVRFEGESDPGDQAVLFALRSRDGRIRGTFVSGFGPQTDPIAAELMRRLDEENGA